MAEIVHTPVLLEETIQLLAPRGRFELMIDATMGEGGHSHAFLSRFPDLSIVGIDADPSIQAIARQRLAEFGDRVRFFSGWSQEFFIDYPAGLKRPNTVFADLGISLFHYERSGRGFSFYGDEPLDMRLDLSCGVSAAELLARMSEKDIADTLYNNAGERYSRRIARAIVEQRGRGAITTNAALAELVKRAVPAVYRHGPIHPATRTFLALRIAVNGELSALPDLLEGAFKVLEPGGRLGVISFHSLEDRIVKNFFKLKNKDCTGGQPSDRMSVPAASAAGTCPPETTSRRPAVRRPLQILTPKGLTADEAEVRRNPPSRSARLRVAEKTTGVDEK